MESTSFYTSPGEFKIFCALDRRLYTRLVTDLLRDPVVSMQTMALWLWFERAGQNNVIGRILSLPYVLINELADEAVTCLKCISNPQFPSSNHGEIPLTHKLMKKGISLQYFHENRLAMKIELRKMITDVCIEVFNDILQEAMERRVARSIARSQMMLQSPAVDQSFIYGFAQRELGAEIPQRRIQINEVPPDDRTMLSPAADQSFIYGFSQLGLGSEVPHHMIRDNRIPQRRIQVNEVPQRRIRVRELPPVDRTVMSPAVDQSFTQGFSQLELGAEIPQRRIQVNEVPADDRTMFVTFSKGYPVAEYEVWEHFVGVFGDCIETVHMQEVRPDEQSLYARIVFYTPSIIQQILNGAIKVKFTINGKHVWMRKFVPKQSNSSPPLILPESIPGSV